MVAQGQGTAGVILLWPTSHPWTDEVDIVETHRADRPASAFTNHGHRMFFGMQGMVLSDREWRFGGGPATRPPAMST